MSNGTGKQNHSRYMLIHGVAGAGSGAIAAIATCPLDVVKTVLQVQSKQQASSKYSGIVATFRTIFREEGIRGLYKGLGPTMLALAPNWGIYFFAYSNFKDLAKQSGIKEGPFMHMISAMGAAAITDVCINPLWMIKTRLQTQRILHGEIRYRSVVHAFQRILREEGVTALFAGLTPQLMGIAHVAIQFPTYERLKLYFAQNGDRRVSELTSLELITASAISKMTASMMAYPHEVLRSRLQFQHRSDPNRYKGIVDATRRIFAEEGWQGFYRGMGTNLLRVTPACAITFTTYEMLVRFFEKE